MEYLNDSDLSTLDEVERSCRKLEDVIECIVSICCAKLPVRVAALFLYNKRKDQLILSRRSVATYSRNALEKSFYGLCPHRTYLGIVGRSFGNRQVMRVDFPIQNSLYDASIDKRDDLVPQSMICLPLISNRQKIGVLQLVDKLQIERIKTFRLDDNDEDDEWYHGFTTLNVASDIGSSSSDLDQMVPTTFNFPDEEGLGSLAESFANTIRRVQARLAPTRKHAQAVLSETESTQILNMFTTTQAIEIPQENRVQDVVDEDEEMQAQMDELLEKIKVYRAVTVVQAVLRGRTCRRRRVLLMLKAKLMKNRLRNASARYIQSMYRRKIRRRVELRHCAARATIARAFSKRASETPDEAKTRILYHRWYKCIAEAQDLHYRLQRLQYIAQKSPVISKRLSQLQAAHRGNTTRRVIHKVFRQNGLVFRKTLTPAIARMTASEDAQDSQKLKYVLDQSLIGGTQNAYRVFNQHQLTASKVNECFDQIRSGCRTTRKPPVKKKPISSNQSFGIQSRRLIGSQAKDIVNRQPTKELTVLTPTEPTRTVSYNMALKIKSPLMYHRTLVQHKRQTAREKRHDFGIEVDRMRLGRQAIQLALQLLCLKDQN